MSVRTSRKLIVLGASVPAVVAVCGAFFNLPVVITFFAVLALYLCTLTTIFLNNDGDKEHNRAVHTADPNTQAVTTIDLTSINAKSEQVRELLKQWIEQSNGASDNNWSDISKSLENVLDDIKTSWQQVRSSRTESISTLNAFSDAIKGSIDKMRTKDDPISRASGKVRTSLTESHEFQKSVLESEQDFLSFFETINKIIAEIQNQAEMLKSTSGDFQYLAEQSNLLALNAAIEASRSTTGKDEGLSVIANEIKKFSEKASNAANRLLTTTSSTLELSVDLNRQTLQKSGDFRRTVQVHQTKTEQDRATFLADLNELNEAWNNAQTSIDGLLSAFEVTKVDQEVYQQFEKSLETLQDIASKATAATRTNKAS